MTTALIAICGIVPIIFLTAALITYAMMQRGQWDKLGSGGRGGGGTVTGSRGGSGSDRDSRPH